jgi:SAM-dependent methyltransferase
MASPSSRPDAWIEALRERFARELRFPELRKGVVALSRLYVEERGRQGHREVFTGAGKRAAFACFYAPLHFLLVSEILRALPRLAPPRRILDLGCGTAAASAAWAAFHGGRPRVEGIDRSPWAVTEARSTLRALALKGRVRTGTIETAPMPRRGEAAILSFAVNELAPESRRALLHRLLSAEARGTQLLVVEPIARGPSPWWPEWSRAFEDASGRSDTWRFAVALPPFVAELDRASGLDHRELTARTLFLGEG